MPNKEEFVLIFDPKGKTNVDIKYVERLKEVLAKNQTSVALFSTLVDSIEGQGKLFLSSDDYFSEDDILFDFERV